MQRVPHILSRGKLRLGVLFIVMAVTVLVATSTVTYAKSKLSLPTQDCAHAQSFTQCNHQDPVVQGCTADARTVEAVAIELKGVQVGLLQLRHSHNCNAFWGRTFSTSKGNAELSLSSPTFNETIPDHPSLITGGPNEVYSDMVYGGLSPTLTGFVVFSAVTQAQAQILSFMM